MKREVLVKFLNKVINIRLKNKYFYQGELKEVADDFIILDDRYDGEIVIDIHEINTLKVKDV